MVRAYSLLYAYALFVLWLGGLSPNAVGDWMTWLDFFACLFALAIVFLARPLASQVIRSALPILLGAALLLTWAFGMETQSAMPWLGWANFAVGCCALVLGVAAAFIPDSYIGGYAYSAYEYIPLDYPDEYIPDAPRGPYVGLGPDAYFLSDERIEADVHKALTRNGLVDPSDIEVEVKKGHVTLKGTVENSQAKFFAGELAESIWGVKSVTNELRLDGWRVFPKREPQKVA